MDDWEKWLGMAVDSVDAGIELGDTPAFTRSAVSRYYYAAYQAVTALFLYEGQMPPTVNGIRRESWSHEVTPDMVLENLGRVLPDRKKRYQIRSNLQELYKTRIFADYSGANPVSVARLKSSRKLAKYIVTLTSALLPQKATES
jgi:uncharacterized protein (UPF0332 family)